MKTCYILFHCIIQFKAVCNRNGFDIVENNNENFYESLHGVLFTKLCSTTTPPHPATVGFNGICFGIPEINVLKGVFAVDYPGNIIVNKVNDGMNNDMLFYCVDIYPCTIAFMFVLLFCVL